MQLTLFSDRLKKTQALARASVVQFGRFQSSWSVATSSSLDRALPASPQRLIVFGARGMQEEGLETNIARLCHDLEIAESRKLAMLECFVHAHEEFTIHDILCGVPVLYALTIRDGFKISRMEHVMTRITSVQEGIRSKDLGFVDYKQKCILSEDGYACDLELDLVDGRRLKIAETTSAAVVAEGGRRRLVVGEGF
ncbi:hypothetical protein Tco_0714232 [Tanacetum coccineum]